jgi:DNA-directed RNA polymerase subunit RPC12/RpoP
MDALDGNAIGGMLIDVFGSEMTMASSTCGTCGAIRPVAELAVYMRAPGTVVRCPTCGSVLMVLVRAHSVTCVVDLAGMASLSPAGPALSAERDPEQISMPNEQQEGTRKDEYAESTVHGADAGPASHVDAGAAG